METSNRAANIRGISNLKLDSRIREAKPVFCPAVPATNSATTAPIKDRPPAIFSAAIKYGKAVGSIRYLNFCHGVALYSANKSLKL